MSESSPDPAAIREYVLTHARLGVYDPLQPRRPAVEIDSFEVELLELDEERSVAHAAGPVVLRTGAGNLEQFLRVTLRVEPDGRISRDADLRAVYIVETDPATGACKETAALANA